MSTTADTSPAKTVSLRAARASDADRVFLLLRQLGDDYAPDRAAFNENFVVLVSDPGTSLLLVAEASNSDDSPLVIGYALTTITPLLYANGRSAQLQELVVGAGYQRSGTGTALLEEIERICRETQVKQLTVASRRSADFYERLGYRSTADFLKRTFD